MLATALSATLHGLAAQPVRVEVDLERGVPSFQLVGLAEAAVRESRVRVKSALSHVGVDLAEYRIVVNMAPADVKKVGGHFDLAIAAATLVAMGLAPPDALERTLFIGELSLSGRVRSVRGALPQLMAARASGLTRALVPLTNVAEAGLVEGIDARTVETIADLYGALRGEVELPVAPAVDLAGGSLLGLSESELAFIDDLADVRGQVFARGAMEAAAAGGHNVLLVGPPGSGKTMLARRLVGILPSLTRDEALEVTAIHSVAGVLPASEGLVRRRPFRAPHHTSSEVALVGGAGDARPGEVSLAHHGVLFLDELPEFRRSTLEVLRQPLEDGVVTISRVHARATYPARPLLVAAMNPCPCGYAGRSTARRCVCSVERVRAYRARISGPLLDRIDIHVSLEPVDVASLQALEPAERSAMVRERVERARAVQRWRRATGRVEAPCNAALTPRDLRAVATLSARGAKALTDTVVRFQLSARTHAKIMRLARTFADLAGVDDIGLAHVAQAVDARVAERGGGNGQWTGPLPAVG